VDQTESTGLQRSGKGREAFRTISEVAEHLDLPQHVLRFWESKFSQVKPLKRGGNRRYYRPDDVTLLTAIKKLLHTDGYTIRGVQKLFKAQGVKATIALALDETGAGRLAASMNQAAAPEKSQEPVADSAAETNPAKDSVPTKDSGPAKDSGLGQILERLKAIRARLN